MGVAALELQRLSASPECAEAVGDLDVRELLSHVRARTLVMHVRDDPRCLFNDLCAESFEVPPQGSGPRGSARFAQRGWPKFGWNLCMRCCSTSPQTKRHLSVKQGMRETEQCLTNRL